MRNLSICGSHLVKAVHPDNVVQSLQIEGIKVVCGIIHTDDMTFDPQSEENQFKVLIKKRAFSCNYRDKALILKAALKALPQQFYSVGSDFVADVIQVGAKVTAFQKGDRVIGNGAYPHSGVDGVKAGVPTNQGSTEFQVFHQAKLMKIPTTMPDDIAAGFSIGTQTAYSMIRKAAIKPGDNVLVTSAKSNTSLFVINALKGLGVNVYATSTSHQFEDELMGMGIKQLIVIDSNETHWLELPEIWEMLIETGGINSIIDPFFDLHVGKVLPLLVRGGGGRYVTCGLYDQYSALTQRDFCYNGLSLTDVMTFAMLNNVQIIGNCLGDTEDLRNGIQDFSTGKFTISVDSSFSSIQEISTFFNRTYNDRNRFGKVIYHYS